MFIQLTGHQVREAETPNEELLLAMTTPAPLIATLAPDLPLPLIELVDRALAFEQEDRWPNARAMQAAVRAVQAELGLEDPVSIGSIGHADGSTESSAPVTLLTPNAIVSSAFRSGLMPWRQRKAFVIGLGALAALVPMLVISRLPRHRAEAAPQPMLGTSMVPIPPVPSADKVEPPDLATVNHEAVTAPEAQAQPAAPSPPAGTAPPPPARPKIDNKVRPPVRPAPRVPEAKPAAAPAPTVAPATESQLPSSLDPLDRRR